MSDTEPTTIKVDVLVNQITDTIDALVAARRAAFEEYPDVEDFNSKLVDLYEEDPTQEVTLTADFIVQYAGCRSMNGALIELKGLRTALTIFSQLKGVLGDVPQDQNYALIEVSDEGVKLVTAPDDLSELDSLTEQTDN